MACLLVFADVAALRNRKLYLPPGLCLLMIWWSPPHKQEAHPRPSIMQQSFPPDTDSKHRNSLQVSGGGRVNVLVCVFKYDR